MLQDQSRNSIASLDHPRARRAQAGAAVRRALEEPAARACSTTAKRRACSSSAARCCVDGDLLLADDGRVVEVQAAQRNRVDRAHRRRADAGARQLSPGQPARGAADRHRLAALPARSRARRHAARLRPRRRRRAGAVRARRRRVCRGLASHARARTSARTEPPAPRAAAANAALQLLRLLHLASPALPIGAFHFSQGLEYAVEARLGDRRSHARSSG